jgi:lysophospholipase L1-like esterase
MNIKNKSVILFQGDSITDCNRDKKRDDKFGEGYAMMINAWLNSIYPEKEFNFLNRGVSGDRVSNLKERWQNDCINLEPDLLSILIGINDCWERYKNNDPTSVEEFKRIYRDILVQVRNEFTEIKIILCEPFLLPVNEEQKKWREDLDPKINIIRNLAREFNTEYLALDGIFAEASTKQKPDFWTVDGIHPTYAGHALIARAWINKFKDL